MNTPLRLRIIAVQTCPLQLVNHLVLCIALVCILYTNASAQYTYVLNEGFETATLSSPPWLISMGQVDRPNITFQTSPVRSGSYAVHLINSTNESASGLERTEIDLPSSDQTYAIRWDKEYWIGYSLYLKNWDYSNYAETVHQMHGVPYGALWQSCAARNITDILIQKNLLSFQTITRPALDILPGNYAAATSVWQEPVQSNVWYDWVMHLRPSTSSTGLTEIWCNGRLIYQQYGPNVDPIDRSGLSAYPSHFFKAGVYNWPWKDGYFDITSREVIYDSIKIGVVEKGYTGGYAGVTPEGSTALPNTKATPGTLTCTLNSSNSAQLSWIDNSSDETAFSIERKINPDGVYSQMGTVSANVTTYVDSSASTDILYYYRIRATNSLSSTSYSNECSIVRKNFSTLPSDFTVVNGTWAVSNGQYQVTQSGTGTLAAALSLYNTPISGDFVLTANCQSVSSSDSYDNFNIVFNYQDANNYYFINQSESASSTWNGLIKVKNGVPKLLASWDQIPPSIDIFRDNMESYSITTPPSLPTNITAKTYCTEGSATYSAGVSACGATGGTHGLFIAPDFTNATGTWSASLNNPHGSAPLITGLSLYDFKYKVDLATTTASSPVKITFVAWDSSWNNAGRMSKTVSLSSAMIYQTFAGTLADAGWISEQAGGDITRGVYFGWVITAQGSGWTQSAANTLYVDNVQFSKIQTTFTPGTTYTLKVQRVGQSILVYRNATLLTSVLDNDFTGGKIGLGVSQLGTGAKLANFSNLSISARLPLSTTAPSGLTATYSATPLPNGRVVLSWSDNSQNEDGYVIERKVGYGSAYTALPAAEAFALYETMEPYVSATATKLPSPGYLSIGAWCGSGTITYSAGIDSNGVGASRAAVLTPNFTSCTGWWSAALTGINPDPIYTTTSLENFKYSIDLATSTSSLPVRVRFQSTDGTSYGYLDKTFTPTGGNAYTRYSGTLADAGWIASGTLPFIQGTSFAWRVFLDSWPQSGANTVHMDNIMLQKGQRSYARPNTSTHEDSALSSGTIYYYRVKAFNASGSSAYSNEVQVSIP